MIPRVHGRPLPPRPDTRGQAYALLRRRCWAGEAPAEELDTADREQLVTELWAAGWTDVEIAVHTRMSTYTTGRIRDRISVSRDDTPRKFKRDADQHEQRRQQACGRRYPQCCPHGCPQSDPHREMTGGICRCCLDRMDMTNSSEGAA